jgi:uncharacterized membrane protein YczE
MTAPAAWALCRIRSPRLPLLQGRARLAGLVAGCGIAALGIATALQAGLGVGPYDVLVDGLARRVGVTFGVASLGLGAVFVLAGRALGGPVGLGTVVVVALVGPLVDAWRLVVPEPATVAVQLGQLAVAVAIIAVGLGLMIAARLGVGPMEVVMLGLADRGVPLRWLRTAMEVGVAVTGWALGGSIGLGTIVIALTLGHALAAVIPRQA